MTGEVIETVRNEHVLVDVKRRGDPLSKHVCDIVVAVSTVVELSSEGSLPFLSGNLVARVGGVENESLELQFTDASDRRSDLESQISVGFVRIGPLNETHFRVKIRADFSPLDDSVQPVRTVKQRGPYMAAPTRVTGRPRSSHMGIDEPVFKKDETGID